MELCLCSKLAADGLERMVRFCRNKRLPQTFPTLETFVAVPDLSVVLLLHLVAANLPAYGTIFLISNGRSKIERYPNAQAKPLSY